MVQMGGSHHAWLEGRGPGGVLIGTIDDATGRVFARFYEYEGTIPAMDSFKRYIRRYGIPVSVYLDKHTTYRSWAKATIEKQLAGVEPKSQFERALSELGVEVIHADSPQAKGRIERLFGTFQDRLIKEMRLAGVESLEQANRFLVHYLPIYNPCLSAGRWRFSVKPIQQGNLYRPTLKSRDLEGILCIQAERVLRNDFTVAYNGKLYQIEEATRTKKVTIQERLEVSMRIFHQGQPLRYQEISARPVKVTESSETRVMVKRATKPSPNHPWKRMGYFQNGKRLQDQ